MKGIAHFLTGIALATSFAHVVHQGAQGILLPVLGGIGGLLPDVLDFRFARYWAVYDDEIDPGSALSTDGGADAVADALVGAMARAFETGCPRRVIVRSVRLAVDLWRRYTLAFRPEDGEIEVRVGPLVNGAGVPYPGSEPDGEASAIRTCPMPWIHAYASEYAVETFSGPTFQFVRDGDRLVVHFLDWHHRWTHSLLLGAFIGLITGSAAAFLWDASIGLWAGLLMGLGFCAHVLEDQLGHMGCNLWWPLTRTRIPGPGWLHADDVAPNVLVVWSALAVTFLNLDRFAPQPRLPFGLLRGLALVLLPWGGVWAFRRLWAWIRLAHSPTSSDLP